MPFPIQGPCWDSADLLITSLSTTLLLAIQRQLSIRDRCNCRAGGSAHGLTTS